MLSTAQATAPAAAAQQPRQRTAASYKSYNAALHLPAALSARQHARAARQLQRSSLRVLATQAPAAPTAGSSAAVDDSGVLDVVVVGAGISGLTTAQVRRHAFVNAACSGVRLGYLICAFL